MSFLRSQVHSAPSHGWSSRRAFVLAAAASVATTTLPVVAQVDVGKASSLRKLVPADQIEQAGSQQFVQTVQEAKQKNALLPASHPQTQRLHAIAKRIIPHTTAWNPRAKDWRWEVVLINSDQINAFCLPGGKIAFYTGILSQLKLTDDEAAMIMGHEMAHALREHARERLAKSSATNLGLRLGAELLGLGNIGTVAADLSSQLLTLKFSREDESEADLVGLELRPRSLPTPGQREPVAEDGHGQQGGRPGVSLHPPERSEPHQGIAGEPAEGAGTVERARKG